MVDPSIPVESPLVTLFVQQGTLSLALVFLQNYLKAQKWFPVLNYERTLLNARFNHWFAIITSGAATLGIHFTYSAQNHELVISGLAFGTIATGCWHWFTQYLMTKTAYTALKGQLTPTAQQLPIAVTPVTTKADA